MTERPPDEHIVWVVQQIARFITDGCGTFRILQEDYLGLDYSTAYCAGGMVISNAVHDALEKEEQQCNSKT